MKPLAAILMEGKHTDDNMPIWLSLIRVMMRCNKDSRSYLKNFEVSSGKLERPLSFQLWKTMNLVVIKCD